VRKVDRQTYDVPHATISRLQMNWAVFARASPVGPDTLVAFEAEELGRVEVPQVPARAFGALIDHRVGKTIAPHILGLTEKEAIVHAVG
jgi:hypothetical protein